MVANMGRRAGEKPVTIPHPYLGAGKKKREYVPPREKKRLQKRLRRYSSIPD